MTRISLKHIVDERGGLRPLMASLTAALGGSLGIEDAAGQRLFGNGDGGTRVPLHHDDRQVGFVTGAPHAELIAELLQFVVAKEAERKSLGAEVLNLYR